MNAEVELNENKKQIVIELRIIYSLAIVSPRRPLEKEQRSTYSYLQLILNFIKVGDFAFP